MPDPQSQPNPQSRLELLRLAQSLGVSDADVMTRAELRAAIEKAQRPERNVVEQPSTWVSVARRLLARVVERGLNLPDAAALIRGDAKFSAPPKAPPPVATVTLARIYAAQGHLERAIKTLNEVLESDPDHELARELREQLVVRRAELLRADPNALQASEPEPSEPPPPVAPVPEAPHAAASPDSVPEVVPAAAASPGNEPLGNDDETPRPPLVQPIAEIITSAPRVAAASGADAAELVAPSFEVAAHVQALEGLPTEPPTFSRSVSDDSETPPAPSVISETPLAPSVLSGLADPGLAAAGPLETGPLETGPLETGPLETGPLEAGLLEAGPETEPPATMATSFDDWRGSDAAAASEPVPPPPLSAPHAAEPADWSTLPPSEPVPPPPLSAPLAAEPADWNTLPASEPVPPPPLSASPSLEPAPPTELISAPLAESAPAAPLASASPEPAPPAHAASNGVSNGIAHAASAAASATEPTPPSAAPEVEPALPPPTSTGLLLIETDSALRYLYWELATPQPGGRFWLHVVTHTPSASGGAERREKRLPLQRALGVLRLEGVSAEAVVRARLTLDPEGARAVVVASSVRSRGLDSAESSFEVRYMPHALARPEALALRARPLLDRASPVYWD